MKNFIPSKAIFQKKQRRNTKFSDKRREVITDRHALWQIVKGDL